MCCKFLKFINSKRRNLYQIYAIFYAYWYSKIIMIYEGEMGELLLLFVHDQEWREARCAVTGPF